jgi:hypothetical protein
MQKQIANCKHFPKEKTRLSGKENEIGFAGFLF